MTNPAFPSMFNFTGNSVREAICGGVVANLTFFGFHRAFLPHAFLPQWLVHHVGVTLNPGFSAHRNAICRKASIAINNIGHLRRYLSHPDIERLAHTLIMTHLDYCNSLLFGLPSYQIEKLQRNQKSRAYFASVKRTSLASS